MLHHCAAISVGVSIVVFFIGMAIAHFAGRLLQSNKTFVHGIDMEDTGKKCDKSVQTYN